MESREYHCAKPNSIHPVFLVIEFHVEQKSNIFLILRGLPGSGKSTLTRAILSRFGSELCCICSADDYFYSPTGEYCYNPNFISEAHVFCQQKVSTSVLDRKAVIIIDNTNVKTCDFVSYLSIAASNGYLTVIAEPCTAWRFDINQLSQRNIHSVPKKKLREMWENFEQLRFVDADSPGRDCNGARVADAIVSDSRRGTVYCVQAVLLPKPTSAQQRSQTKRPIVDYRHPEMLRSFHEGLERSARVAQWSSLLEERPNAPQQVNFESSRLPAELTKIGSSPGVTKSSSASPVSEVKNAEDDEDSSYLASIFPEFDPSVLADIYRANGKDLAATVEELRHLSVAYSSQLLTADTGVASSLGSDVVNAVVDTVPAHLHGTDSLNVNLLEPVEFSLGECTPDDELKPQTATETNAECSDDQVLSGLMNKRTLLALHRRFGVNDSDSAEDLLAGLADDILSDWRPPDSVLLALYAAFLDHIGLSPHVKPATLTVDRAQPRQPASYSSPSLSVFSRWSHADPLASRLSLNRLSKAFPGLSEDVAVSLLADCGNSYEVAFSTLLECGLEPAIPNDHRETAQLPIAPLDDRTSADVTQAGANAGVYTDLSRISADYRSRRRDCLTRAAYAKDSRVQSHHMRQAGLLAQQERQERAVLVATATTAVNHRSRSVELDLHGMTASEAIQAIKTTLSEGSNEGLKTFRVITGHGKHSNGGPVLRPVVKNFLTQKRIPHEELYLGCFEARVA